MDRQDLLLKKFQLLTDSTHQMINALTAINSNLKNIYVKLDGVEKQVSDLKVVKLKDRRTIK